MSTLSVPGISLIDGMRESYQNDMSVMESGSLLWGNDPPSLDGTGAGSAPTFTQLLREMAEHKQAPSLGKLSEALVSDVLTMLEAKEALADAYEATELMRNLLESRYEFFRELARLVFTSLSAALPGATDAIKVPALAAQLRRLSPRVDLAALASPTERHFPLIQMDVMTYVEPTAVDQMQGKEPVSTYAKLGELESVLVDARRRLQGKRGQEVQVQAVKTLAALTFQAMTNGATSDVIPRITVAAMNLAQRFLTHMVGETLDRLMVEVVARFATDPEELSHQLLKPMNSGVLTSIERAAQRVKGEDSTVFERVIRPRLQSEVIRSALTASEIREVSLKPSALQAILTGWTFRDPLMRRAVFGSNGIYERWLLVTQALDKAQSRSRTPLFIVPATQAPSQGEHAESIEFMPATLAKMLTDYGTSKALAGALHALKTLTSSKIAMQIREQSLAERQREATTTTA